MTGKLYLENTVIIDSTLFQVVLYTFIDVKNVTRPLFVQSKSMKDCIVPQTIREKSDGRSQIGYIWSVDNSSLSIALTHQLEA